MMQGQAGKAAGQQALNSACFRPMESGINLDYLAHKQLRGKLLT
jgi:hypothetical protein